MREIELPPLPEAVHWQKETWAPNASKIWEAWSADQMREYARQAVEKALMDAAHDMQIDVMNHDLPIECEDAYDWLGKRASAIRG